MKLIKDILYIEWAEMIEAGVSKGTLDSSVQRKSMEFMNDPNDKRRVLIEYTSLKPNYKKLLTERYGDPYNYVAKDPIKKLVVTDHTAESFYMQYKFDSGDCLPIEHVNKYTVKASWLNMLNKIGEDRPFIKKTLGLTLDNFYNNVCELIVIDKVDLPTSYKRLREKMKEYKEKGYGCLIDWRFGNNLAAKVTDNISESILLQLIAHPNQYDDVLITTLYNKWANDNKYETIKPSTVGVWRRKKEFDITISRYGNGAFNEKYIRQVKGLLPTAVGMLWESDDYNLNYYYQDGEDNMQRYVSYIVADSKHGLVLGKSYRQAKSPVWEMVKLAYIDAMYYVRSLVNDGKWYLPFELKADHWNQKSAFPYFKSIANFIPPGHANKHRGYIEQLFGSPHAKRAEKLAAHHSLNYNGNNITAVNRGVNIEALNYNKDLRPYVGTEAEEQIEKFFTLMRNMPNITRENLNAPSRQQLWIEDWNKLTDEQKRPISDEQFLLLFGFKHEPQNGNRNTITNRGIEPQIKGVKYSYDLPNYAENIYLIGKEVDVYYDPYDMSRVLVTDNDKVRFIAQSATLHPRALQDTTINSRAALNMVLSEKKLQVEYATTKGAKRMQLVGNSVDAEAAMLGAFVPKEIKNRLEDAAERMMVANRNEDEQWETKQEAFMKDEYNLDDFFENDNQ